MAQTNEHNALFKQKVVPLSFLVIAVAEFLGSSILIFLSCAGSTFGIQGDISSMHASFNAGLAVLAAIQIFGPLSGAHVNPCVTLAAFIMNQISLVQIPVYVVTQLAGSLAGSALHMAVTPSAYVGYQNGTGGVCVTKPSSDITYVQGLAIETLLSIVLNFANCAAWDSKNSSRNDSISIRIGLIVVALNLAAGAYTGASMNPVRSFGPSVWTGDYTAHWIYWVGPTIGAVTASLCYRYIFGN